MPDEEDFKDRKFKRVWEYLSKRAVFIDLGEEKLYEDCEERGWHSIDIEGNGYDSKPDL